MPGSRPPMRAARKGRTSSAMADDKPTAGVIPTVQVISELAGVSKSTVSRALADDKGIAPKTKRRIFSIAERLGYMPNAMARGLTTQRSGVIGFVSSRLDHYFYQEAFEQLGQVAAEHRKQIMLFQIPDGSDLRDVVPTMAQYRLDGCIIIAATPVSPEALAVCQRYRMPVVLLNRVISGAQASSVLCDHVSATQEIAELLLEAGHKRLALLAGRSNNVVSRDREVGFMLGLKAAERELFARIEGRSEFEPAFAAVKELISSRAVPDAIFAVNDIMAYGAIDALRQARLRVPSDVSVVGFDNGRAGAWPAYDLTTYSQPIEQMFRRAIEMIEARAVRDMQTEAVYIRGELVIRGSARLPARLMATLC
jgi:DNA-binding LacI/PurR family transcriptional regulator